MPPSLYQQHHPSQFTVKPANQTTLHKNQVVVSSDGTALTISADIAGITVRNINFIDTSSSGEAASLKGHNNGFYQCQFISGTTAIRMNPGVGLIVNSYIEASDTLIAGQGNLYVFDTAIVPSQDSALIVQNQGMMSGDPDSNLLKSTIVIDRSSVSQKARGNTKNCYLSGASGKGSIVIYRNCMLGSLIAPSGAHVDSTTQDESNLYGEYGNSGLGSYSNNRAARSKYVTLLGPSDLSSYSLGAVLAGGNPAFATSDTTWIDPNALAAIESADVLGPNPSSDGSGDGSGSSGSSSLGLLVEVLAVARDQLPTMALGPEVRLVIQAPDLAAPVTALGQDLAMGQAQAQHLGVVLDPVHPVMALILLLGLDLATSQAQALVVQALVKVKLPMDLDLEVQVLQALVVALGQDPAFPVAPEMVQDLVPLALGQEQGVQDLALLALVVLALVVLALALAALVLVVLVLALALLALALLVLALLVLAALVLVLAVLVLVLAVLALVVLALVVLVLAALALALLVLVVLVLVLALLALAFLVLVVLALALLVLAALVLAVLVLVVLALTLLVLAVLVLVLALLALAVLVLVVLALTLLVLAVLVLVLVVLALTPLVLVVLVLVLALLALAVLVLVVLALTLLVLAVLVLVLVVLILAVLALAVLALTFLVLVVLLLALALLVLALTLLALVVLVLVVLVLALAVLVLALAVLVLALAVLALVVLALDLAMGQSQAQAQEAQAPVLVPAVPQTQVRALGQTFPVAPVTVPGPAALVIIQAQAQETQEVHRPALARDHLGAVLALLAQVVPLVLGLVFQVAPETALDLEVVDLDRVPLALPDLAHQGPREAVQVALVMEFREMGLVVVALDRVALAPEIPHQNLTMEAQALGLAPPTMDLQVMAQDLEVQDPATARDQAMVIVVIHQEVVPAVQALGLDLDPLAVIQGLLVPVHL